MLLKEPYNSKRLKYYNLKGVDSEVLRYVTIDYAWLKENQFVKIKNVGDLSPVVLYGTTASEDAIIPLDHPYFIPSSNVAVLDLRKVLKVSGEHKKVEIRNEPDYRLTLVRFVLSCLWRNDQVTPIYSLELAHSTYATWLSDNLTHKFGLDAGDSVRIKALAYVFYKRCFDDVVDGDELHKILIRAGGDVILRDVIESIYPKTLGMNTIDDFCEYLYKVTDNVRLKGFDYNVLTNVLNNNWLGVMGKDLTLLALEHPPTWCALVYASITQRTYNKSFVSTVVSKVGKRGRDQDFVKAVEVITKNQILEA